MEHKDIYMCIKEVADFLGLKYHHTRKLLLADTELKMPLPEQWLMMEN